MNQTKFLVPDALLKLQNKLLKLRQEEKLLLQNGDIGFGSAPSNIALIKYWGKSLNSFQTPDNPSLSYTLENFRSQTKVTVVGRFFPENERPDFIPPHEFYLTDIENKSVQSSEVSQKLDTFLKHILSPYAQDIGLKIESFNNFPTACGMASSASGMAALCGAIANLLNLKKHFSKPEQQYWLSQWARLGSGSALRSVCMKKNSQFVAWELGETFPHSYIKDIPYHTKWNSLRHCVFVLNSHKKDTTSSAGHLLAHTSSLHAIRVENVKANFNRFKSALKNFDFDYVTEATETDALSMHAVMQTSKPAARYLTEEVSVLISEFIQFRHQEKIRAFWTLDAGPNVHFLYLAPHRQKMLRFHKKISQILNKYVPIYE